MKKKIVVLASGSGSNLRAIINSIETGFIKNAEIVSVISNKKNVLALDISKYYNIKSLVLSNKNKSRQFYTSQLIQELDKLKADLICLAGFMVILDKKIFEVENSKYKNKIINIHPSLLPKFGGKGMYGLNVHKAVFAAGEKESGASVHYVTSECDVGEIILQEKVNIEDCKTPEEIAKKVLKVEHKIYSEAINKILK
ncbi:MAG: phosphoribosylglycinamide formyltransferase [Elusimicrobiota bacterium]|jgi:phosphoribosylglycinamide formyltransferase-1|nr:phosphoribosylglycinamide formyltransferase [Elusimicrobiota bacterium]